MQRRVRARPRSRRSLPPPNLRLSHPRQPVEAHRSTVRVGTTSRRGPPPLGAVGSGTGILGRDRGRGRGRLRAIAGSTGTAATGTTIVPATAASTAATARTPASEAASGARGGRGATVLVGSEIVGGLGEIGRDRPKIGATGEVDRESGRQIARGRGEARRRVTTTRAHRAASRDLGRRCPPRQPKLPSPAGRRK